MLRSSFRQVNSLAKKSLLNYRRFAIVNITDDDHFEDIVADPRLTVVQFSAVWCGPCQTLKPHLEKLSNELDAQFIHVDIDSLEDLAMDHKVSAVPTIQFYKNNNKLKDVVVGGDINKIKAVISANI